MDKVFDSFFDDIFNKDNNSPVHTLNTIKINNTVETPLFDSSNHQKILKINVSPDSQRFSSPSAFETLRAKHITNDFANNSFIKNFQDKIAQTDFQLEKRINKIDHKVTASATAKQPHAPQNELSVEQQKYKTITVNSLTENNNIQNSNQIANTQTNSRGGDKVDKPSDSGINTSNNSSKSIKDSDSSESLINKITLNERFSNIVQSFSSTAKLVKYSFYFGIALVILMLGLMMVKFCIAAKENDKPIKTRHSINEIEDELNNMRGREKLF